VIGRRNSSYFILKIFIIPQRRRAAEVKSRSSLLRMEIPGTFLH
jgi:hypothetical protein